MQGNRVPYKLLFLFYLFFLFFCQSNKEANKKLLKERYHLNIQGLEQALEQGADINSQYPNEGTTLHYAASYGYLEMVQFLISKDADINVKDNRGNTPIVDKDLPVKIL